jgi:hypothetical protein
MTTATTHSLKAALLVVGLAAISASAQDRVVCVAEAANPAASCVPRECDVRVETLSAALGEAEAFVSSAGEAAVAVCVTEVPVVTERLIVDNRANQLGAPLSINFVENLLCPDSGDAPGQSAIMWIPGSQDFLFGVHVDLRDQGPCGSSPRPGLDVVGNGNILVTGTFRGTEEFAIRSRDGSLGRTEIRSTAITHCAGAAVIADRRTQLSRVQIVGCTSALGGLIEASGPDGLELAHGLVAGNRTGGAASGLLVGFFPAIENVAFVANLVQSDVPLIALEPFAPRWYLDGEELRQRSGNAIAHSIFSRNIASSDPGQVPAWDPPIAPRPSDSGAEACSSDGYEEWLDTIVLPPGDGFAPLVRYGGGPVDAFATIFRTVFIGNEVGGSPLVQIATSEPWLSLQVLHNTGVDNGSSPFVQAASLRDSDEFIVARNHFEAPIPTFLELAGPARFAVVSHNSGGTGGRWAEDAAPEGSLIGPEASAPEWQVVEQVEQASPCERHVARCPGLSSMDCESFADVGYLHCPVDRAREVVAVPGLAAGPDEAWPGSPEFFAASDGSQTAIGATGWRCEGIRPTVDEVPALGFGDGDGFPDVVDCDNSDAFSTPALSGQVGEPWCAGASDLDDEGAPLGPEDVPVGCVGRGCGAALGPGNMALLVLLIPLVATRRAT